MVCQMCGKYAATTHFKRTVGGKTEEYYLCPSCASKQGISSMWGGFGLDLGDFWGSLFAEPTHRQQDTVRCENCGHSFSEIAHNGRVGCAQCYVTFYDRLLPSIQRIHGRAGHVGKAAVQAGEQVQREQELETLRKQLAECLANQEYERCAELRDRIRALEENGNE